MPPNHHDHAEQARKAMEREHLPRVCSQQIYPPLPTRVLGSGEENDWRPYHTGPTILIIGHGRHGKDEAAAQLHGRGDLRYCGSTSWQVLPFIARHVGLPEQVMWETRHEHRQYWKDYCDIFRKDDPSRLVKLALRHGNIVAGIRDKVEIDDARQLFDAILWVNRPGFPDDSTLTFDPAEYFTDVIHNDGTLEEFRTKVLKWAAGPGWI